MPRKQKSLGRATPWDETAETVVTGTGAAETGFAWGAARWNCSGLCGSRRGRFIYKKEKREKTVRRKRKSFLVSLLLILVLVFSGCQTAAVQEDQTASVSQGQEETIDSSSAGTSRETQEESQTPQKEEEYIDEAYVDANYGGGEEEDLSKYEETSDTGQAGSGGSSQASSDGTSGSSAQGGTQNGSAQSAQANEENYYTDPVPEGMPEPVEPQDTAVNQDSQLTCTLLVECSTILNNMGDLTEGKESLVPSDGIIYGPATVVFYEGESVYDVLLRRCRTIGFIWKRNSLPCITALTWKESITFII